MDWNAVLEFARGPFFQVALLVFIGGMFYRLVRVIALGWKPEHVPAKGSQIEGVARSYLKGLLILPFFPWVKNTFNRNPVTYLAGGLFHLGLFTVLTLGTAHMLVWKSLIGIGWPTLPMPIVGAGGGVGVCGDGRHAHTLHPSTPSAMHMATIGGCICRDRRRGCRACRFITFGKPHSSQPSVPPRNSIWHDPG